MRRSFRFFFHTPYRYYTTMTFEQIQELIKLLDATGIGEFKLNEGDQKIHIRTRAYVEALQENKFMSPAFMPFAQPTISLPQNLPPSISTPAIEGNSQPAPKPEITPPPAKVDNDNYITIKSPMVGTFYRRPAPDRDAFVKIGDTISKGAILCIIEAMKLNNEIESETSGTIIKVLVEDAAPVEYDQPIFLIQP